MSHNIIVSRAVTGSGDTVGKHLAFPVPGRLYFP